MKITLKVFIIAAAIMTSTIANKRQPQLTTQSDPMLVINNKLHPKFQKDSHSRKVRNGVGVTAPVKQSQN